MASLQERKRRGENAFVIQFYLNGKRKSLFLGAKYSRSFAEEICRVVEKVVVALTTGSNVDRRTYAWLESMEVDLRERFESAGLLEPEIRLTLGELFDAYFRAEDSATPRSPSGTKRARRRFSSSFSSVRATFRPLRNRTRCV